MNPSNDISQEIVTNSFSFSEGDPCYLIDIKWWNKLQEHFNELKDEPGEINNSCIIINGNLLPNLQPDTHFKAINESSWKKLKERYNGGPEIKRKVLKDKSGGLVLEIYPLQFKIMWVAEPKSKLQISRRSLAKDLINRVAETMYIPPHKCHVKYDNGNGTWVPVDKQSTTLEDLGIKDGAILFGSKDKNLTPTVFNELVAKSTISPDSEDSGDDEPFLPPNPTPIKFNSNLSKSTSSYSRNYESEPGVSGLQNIGNTCFMNSALQCLSNTPSLTRYFLEDKYKNDINRNNPLGMEGKLAESYASLIKKLWSSTGSVTPNDFKYTISKYAPQFSGYRQHDSQELLAFLLDGLHEDLNRIVDKPYITLKENKNRPEEEVAKEAWDAHVARNQSVIVDLFQGQLKSTVQCPDEDCGNVSITFDPFMYLSLPIPYSMTRKMKVTYIPFDKMKAPVDLMVTVNQCGIGRNIAEAVFEMLRDEESIPSLNDLHVVEVFSGKVYKVLDDVEIEDIQQGDIVCVYQVEPLEEYMDESSDNGTSSEKKSVYISIENDYNAFTPKEKLRPNLVKIELNDGKISKDEFYSTLAIFYNIQFTDMNDLQKMFKLSKSENYFSSPQEEHFSVNKNFEKYKVQWNKETFDSQLQPLATIKATQHSSLTKKNEKINTSIQDCLSLFNKPEKLSKEDSWFCSKCKKFQEATKKIDIWRFPKILVVNFKRFFFSKNSRNKIETPISFPFHDFDLSPWQMHSNEADDPPVYDLYAASMHMGGLGGGHYTAYAQNFRNKKWYYFNDSSVSARPISELESNGGAYVLFYKRRKTEKTEPEESTTTTTTTTTTSTTSTTSKKNDTQEPDPMSLAS
eukprot:TRINITY_DN11291_c0_g1_i1.p1 TRINITY_DN11291_c0_g1~~TRINITY_DN11291_c0_g1_i1.p1  ORF type:complete len:854 (+),score=174.30 TRINITY_DN11291_c0_g1_i1:15-2576(+)